MVGPEVEPGGAAIRRVFAMDLRGRCTLSTDPGLPVGQDLRETSDDVEALERALSGASFTRARRVDDRLLHTRFSPLRSVDGTLQGAVAVELDATEQAATRADLVRFRALVETSGDFIAIAGLDGGVLYVNPAGRALVGLASDVDVTSTTIRDYLTPDGIKRSELIEQPAVVEHGRWQGESTLKGPAGGPVPVEISSFLMPDPETGEPFALATVQRDITERLAAQRAQEGFITLVAHELRTPLASVKGYVEIASDAVEDGADAASVSDFLRVATRNIDRMERLVEQILRIAASERGPSPDARRPADLVRVVAQAAESARPAVEAAGLRLRVTSGRPVTVRVDERFVEVVDNLLSNAVKYTPAGGEVEVSVAREDGAAVLRVSDTGPGVPVEERDAIFEKFARGESLSHQAIPGLGLGLFVCREIVDAHEGKIAIGEAPGGGARLTVRLPLALTHAQEAASGA